MSLVSQLIQLYLPIHMFASAAAPARQSVTEVALGLGKPKQEEPLPDLELSSILFTPQKHRLCPAAFAAKYPLLGRYWYDFSIAVVVVDTLLAVRRAHHQFALAAIIAGGAGEAADARLTGKGFEQLAEQVQTVAKVLEAAGILSVVTRRRSLKRAGDMATDMMGAGAAGRKRSLYYYSIDFVPVVNRIRLKVHGILVAAGAAAKPRAGEDAQTAALRDDAHYICADCNKTWPLLSIDAIMDFETQALTCDRPGCRSSRVSEIPREIRQSKEHQLEQVRRSLQPLQDVLDALAGRSIPRVDWAIPAVQKRKRFGESDTESDSDSDDDGRFDILLDLATSGISRDTVGVAFESLMPGGAIAAIAEDHDRVAASSASLSSTLPPWLTARNTAHGYSLADMLSSISSLSNSPQALAAAQCRYERQQLRRWLLDPIHWLYEHGLPQDTMPTEEKLAATKATPFAVLLRPPEEQLDSLSDVEADVEWAAEGKDGAKERQGRVQAAAATVGGTRMLTVEEATEWRNEFLRKLRLMQAQQTAEKEQFMEAFLWQLRAGSSTAPAEPLATATATTAP
jgi:hypothetical protein